MKSALWSIGKYILATLLLIFVVRQAGPDKITGYLKQIPPLKLLLGFIMITFAQIVSGLRMRYFFNASGFKIQRRYAIILFYVGSFYNFLLPGGIGGDAYKIFLARKRMSVTTLEGIRIMLADRASGLCVIMLTMIVALSWLDFSSYIPHTGLILLVCAIITVAAYLFLCKWLVKIGPAAMLASLRYSITIQGLWAATLITIWQSLSDGRYLPEYIALYCASGITGMLPISVGGLGVKEMTYFYGAQELRHWTHSGVNGDLGIAISLCIFFLIFAASLPGILWLNKVEKADHEEPK